MTNILILTKPDTKSMLYPRKPGTKNMLYPGQPCQEEMEGRVFTVLNISVLTADLLLYDWNQNILKSNSNFYRSD